jgi:uncharacterized membrane protein YhhN
MTPQGFDMESFSNNDKKQATHLGKITILFSLLALVSAILTIYFDLAEAQTTLYLFKPLTTILILMIAVAARQPPSARYRQAIVAGLIFSLIGDVVFVIPQDLFLFGLVSFLIAHLFYINAFVSVGGFYRSFLGALPFLLSGIILAAILWPTLGDMRAPALIYMVIILVMAWQALGQWRQSGETRALQAFVGAILFVFSDLALAVNKFANPIDMAALVVLGTYYPGQWLIALSAGREHP